MILYSTLQLAVHKSNVGMIYGFSTDHKPTSRISTLFYGFCICMCVRKNTEHVMDILQLDLVSGMCGIWMIVLHIGKCIAPFSGYNQNCILMKSGPNQWIHLCHKATQPTEKRDRNH